MERKYMFFSDNDFSRVNVHQFRIRFTISKCDLVSSGFIRFTQDQFSWLDSCEDHEWIQHHYDDVIMSAIASQITSLTIVYSTVYPGADQSKHQSSASLAFVWEIHRGPVNSPHKWPVTRKMFPFDDVIMTRRWLYSHNKTRGNKNSHLRMAGPAAS